MYDHVSAVGQRRAQQSRMHHRSAPAEVLPSLREDIPQDAWTELLNTFRREDRHRHGTLSQHQLVGVRLGPLELWNDIWDYVDKDSHEEARGFIFFFHLHSPQ